MSDDTLPTPIGTVVDVAVGSDGIVYLLDTQTSLVVRIATDGTPLSSLGRRGEGPGEFMHPRLVTARQGGGCVVVQDFYSPAVCLSPDGAECLGPDVSSIRSLFAITEFFGARSDNTGRFFLTAMTTDRMPDAGSTAENLGIAWSVLQLGSNDRRPRFLFTDHREYGDETTVRLVRHGSSFTDRCWDIDSDGRLLFADPAGGYSVTIGHPADGKSRRIDLPIAASDEGDLKKLAKSTGQDASDIPRIASVYWLDGRHFLVKPMACVPGRTSSRGGTFELFDTEGRSKGRAVLDCDYDPDRDAFFLRNGMLVIIKGGKSAAESEIQRKAAMIGKTVNRTPASDSATDVIIVNAYDLASYYKR